MSTPFSLWSTYKWFNEGCDLGRDPDSGAEVVRLTSAALISNLIVLIGWPTPATGLATGGILLAVVAVDAYLRRRTGAQR